MKKGFFVLSAFFGSLMLSAGIPDSLKKPEEKSEVRFFDDFSGGLNNWKMWRGRQVFKIVPGTGDNGSPGLVYERSKPNKSYDLLQYWFKGIPGERYRARVMCKLDGVHSPDVKQEKLSVQILNVVHFADGTKKRTGSKAAYVSLRGKKDLPWQEVVLEFSVPPGTESSAVGLSLYWPNLAGKVTYDNFILERLGGQIKKPEEKPEEKSQNRFSDDFSNGLENWKMWRGRQVFKIVPGTGNNGSPGLVYERSKPNKSYDLLQYWFKGVPGKRCRARVMCKLDGVYCPDVPQEKLSVQILNVVHFADGTNKRTGSKAALVALRGKKDLPWQEVVLEFSVPPGTESSAVGLSLYRPNLAGKVTFDNFILEPLDSQDAVMNPGVTK